MTVGWLASRRRGAVPRPTRRPDTTATGRPFEVVLEVAGGEADAGSRAGANPDDVEPAGRNPEPDRLVRHIQHPRRLVDRQEGGFMRRSHGCAVYCMIATTAKESP